MPELDEVTQNLMSTIEKATVKCWNCNFCISVCPLILNTGGFYSHGGSGLTQSLYYSVKWGLIDGDEKNELLELIYRCTTCNACVNRCKDLSAGIPLLDIIETGRKLLVERAIGPMVPQRKALEGIYKHGNPYGRKQKKRLDWLEDLKVKFLPDEKAEVLLFIGCSSSYDPALYDVARSLIKLFQYFKVDFGILKEEKCSADMALRLGDEALFEEVSAKNAELFKKTGVSTIVAISPHDYNIFLKEYPGLENIEIKHYTHFFADLLESRGIDYKKDINANVTYHDPCYLSKHNHDIDPPRKLLASIPKIKLVEMTPNGRDSLCCGGGGGRMFTEVEEEERLSDMRVKQAEVTVADIIATACPWCHLMLETAVQDLKLEEKMKVKDIAEIMAEALDL